MGGVIGIVIASCVVGLLWAFWNYLQVKKVQIGQGSTGAYESVGDVNESEVQVLLEIGDKISEVKIKIFRVQKSS
jgi:hypothetical protein